MLINLLVVLPTYSGFIHSVSLDTEISAEACLVVWTKHRRYKIYQVKYCGRTFLAVVLLLSFLMVPADCRLILDLLDSKLTSKPVLII